MSREFVEIVQTFDHQGFLVEVTIDGKPFDIPKQENPSIAILIDNVDWVKQKRITVKKESEKVINSLKLLQFGEVL